MIQLTWLGHSCFRVRAHGYTIVLDPFENGSVPGFRDLNETANLVLCSHDHYDHNAAGVVKIVDGNTENPFHITTLSSFHDDQSGALRGKNTITILECDGVRIAHLGDLGCTPGELALERLYGVDLLLIPVGGHYTIDGDAAFDLTRHIEPKTVIPMHYRSEHFGFDVLTTEELFLSHYDCHTVIHGNTVDLTDLPAGAVVLTY